MTEIFLKTLLPIEIFFAVVMMLVGWLLLRRLKAGNREPIAQPMDPKLESDIAAALTLYLCGNSDPSQLQELASLHPLELRQMILRYQTLVAGRRNELCELAVDLGCIDAWKLQAASLDPAKRHEAFDNLAAMAYHYRVRAMVGPMMQDALKDPDERIRISASRILLAGENEADAVMVFKAAVRDTASVREAISSELSHFAPELSVSAIPDALRSPHTLNILRLLLSWERALPIPDVLSISEYPDPSVRTVLMRVLRYLPNTPENRAALAMGGLDSDLRVREAAEETRQYMKALLTSVTEKTAAGAEEMIRCTQ